VPYDHELFVTAATAVSPAQPPAAAAAAVEGTPAARVAVVLGSASMQSSIAQMDTFISSYAGRPDLNMLLHEPALKKGGSSTEGLPVKLLREFEGAIHLLSPDSIADFCSRLPSISTAGLAALAADRLVRPELAAVYGQLAVGIAELSSKLQGRAEAAAVTPGRPQLRLQHYCQVNFGRLDLAWEAAAVTAAGGMLG